MAIIGFKRFRPGVRQDIRLSDEADIEIVVLSYRVLVLLLNIVCIGRKL